VFNSYQSGNYFQTLNVNLIKINKTKYKINSNFDNDQIEGNINNPSNKQHENFFKKQNNK